MVRLIVLILIAFVSITYFAFISNDDQTISSNVLSDIRPKIIILPFEIQTTEANFRGEQADLSLSINNTLSDLNTDVKFIDSNETKLLTKENFSYKDLAENNDISFVVTGTVQNSKEFIRVQFRVVEAASSETIFKEQYDFSIEDQMISVQEKVAMYIMK